MGLQVRYPESWDPELCDLIKGMLKLAPQDRLTINQIVNHPALTRHLEEFKKPIAKAEHDLLVRNFILNLQGNSHREVPDVVTQELIFRKSQSVSSENNGHFISQNSQKLIADLQEIKRSLLTTQNTNMYGQEYKPKLESKRDIVIETSYKMIPLEKSFLESVRTINPEDVVNVVEDKFFHNFDMERPVEKAQTLSPRPIVVKNAEQVTFNGFNSARQSNVKPEMIGTINSGVRPGVQGQAFPWNPNFDSRSSKISKSTNVSKRRIDAGNNFDTVRNSKVMVMAPIPNYTRQEPISTQMHVIQPVKRQENKSPLPTVITQGQIPGLPMTNQSGNSYYGIPQSINFEKRSSNFAMTQEPQLQYMPAPNQTANLVKRPSNSPIYRPLGQTVPEPPLNFAEPVMRKLNDLGGPRVLMTQPQNVGFRVRAISASRSPMDTPLNQQVNFKK